MMQEINNDLYSINLPGRIVTYYPDDQTADILICAERVNSSSTTSKSLSTREILQKVPVHTPSGGGWSMTMPIKAGNTCILFFSQIGYDHWFYQDKNKGGTLAGDPVPHLRRQFSENDGYALVGLNTLPRKINSYSANHSQWRNEDATQIINLKDDLSIEIDSPVSVTINAPNVIVNSTDTTINTETASVIASTQVDVMTPQLNLSCSTSVVATTPLFSITGNLLVGGGIGGGGAPAPAGGLSITGASDITGTLNVTGNITTPNTIVNGKSVDGHSHSNPEGGNVGTF